MEDLQGYAGPGRLRSLLRLQVEFGANPGKRHPHAVLAVFRHKGEQAYTKIESPPGTRAMTELTVTLPDDLARKAREAGLLSPEGIERALRDALKREAGRKLLEIGQSMQAAKFPPMSEEEIQAEVDAVRAARRAKRDAPGA